MFRNVHYVCSKTEHIFQKISAAATKPRKNLLENQTTKWEGS